MNEQTERLLVVDDEPAVCRVTAQRLERQGYNVTMATDATGALDLLAQKGFALALVDMRMPEKDGLWLLKQVWRYHPGVCVIMLTAVADVHTAVDCLRQGATDYLLKPVPGDVLTLTVERALRERRMKLELERYQKHLEEKVEEQARRIRQLYLGSVRSLAISLEAKDHYTRGHSERVAEFAVRLAQHLGLSKADTGLVDLAGLLHDIGKIGVREEVLNKPGRLTSEEFEHVKQHAALGAQILEPIAEDPRLVKAVLHHHENWDGTGYPHGLAGEAIPLLAQILKVTDVYEALTSNRPYRPARSPEEAHRIMEEEIGTVLPPEVTTAFFALLAEPSAAAAPLSAAADSEAASSAVANTSPTSSVRKDVSPQRKVSAPARAQTPAQSETRKTDAQP
jgi:putative nucleotidyltransferase with HDIG domain